MAFDETGNVPVVDPHEPAEPHCHRCGAPHDRFQEYCLECGARLAPLPQLGGGPGSPYWFWVSLIVLLVVALVTAAVVIAATDDDGTTASTAGTDAARDGRPDRSDDPAAHGHDAADDLHVRPDRADDHHDPDHDHHADHARRRRPRRAPRA